MRSMFFSPARARGIFFVIVAATMFVLIALAGLAIDATLLYVTKRKVQNAIDAAVVSGAKLVVQGIPVDVAETRARALFVYNLAVMGFSAAERQRIVTANDLMLRIEDEGRNISGEATVVQPTWLLGVVPGFADSNRVFAASSAINLKLEVVLVVDESYSMDDSLPNPPPGCGDKSCAARYAVKEFIKLLLPYDEVALVGFSTDYADSGLTDLQAFANDARQILPFTLAGAPNTRFLPGNSGRFDSAVGQITRLGNTNIGSGLRKAREILDARTPEEHVIRAVILLTDGAPSWNHPTPLTSVENMSRPWYVDCLDTAHRTELTQSFARGVPIAWNSAALAPLRSEELGRRLRFMDSIREADLTLDAGYFIYSVGLGQIDNQTLTPPTSSPFQDGRRFNPANVSIENQDWVKQFLLIRLANDQGQMVTPPILPSPPPDPLPPYYWDFPCIRSGAQMRDLPVGLFSFAPSGDALVNTFRDLGGRIRTRLSG